jgi:hypothetical protein
MGYIVPLFRHHPIFDFLDSEKTESDIKILRAYFESNDSANAVHLVEENDQKYSEYLEGLLKARRHKIFNSENEIPDEKNKIIEQVNAGNTLAIEMKKILDVRTEIPRSWPIPEVEENKKRYAEWKKITSMEEQALSYVLHDALKAIYYPRFFFEQEIFKLEDAYRGFKYDFMGFVLGPEGLYLSYLIYQKKGTEKVFDNLREFIVSRYVPKPTFGIDAISLLGLFMWGEMLPTIATDFSPDV